MNELTLIGLTGAAGSGKDTAAQYLVERYGFVDVAFADPLREMACVLCDHAGIDYAWVTEPHLKNQPIPGFHFSGRQFMQRVGTEAVRALDPNAWVTALARHIGLEEGMHRVGDRIVITDVRFPNEAAWLKLQGGYLLRLQRNGTGQRITHESERYVDALDAALDIDNDGTLHQLHTRLDMACKALGIDQQEYV